MPDQKADQTIACRGCHQPFTFTVGEQEFYERKGFKETPKRCKPCRELRKAAKGEAQHQAEEVDHDSEQRRARYAAERRGDR